MRNLIQFFVKYHHWFLFAVLEVISAVLLFGFNRYQSSVWVSSANAVAGTIYEWDAGVKSFFSLAETNEKLTERNIALEQEVNRLARLYTEATHDTTAQEREGLRLLERYETIPAKVIGNSVSTPHNLITIDRGSADGIRGDMGVVSGNGVVGIVYLVGKHHSVVMPVINVRSRISCRIKGSGYFGYSKWDAADPAMVDVEDIPRHSTFKVGDDVETSGYSAIFPEGILVGRVVETADSDDGMSYSLRVKLAVDFSNLRDVRVISSADFSERARLLEAAKDSLGIK